MKILYKFLIISNLIYIASTLSVEAKGSFGKNPLFSISPKTQSSLLSPHFSPPQISFARYFKKYAHPKFSDFTGHLGIGLTSYSGDLSRPLDLGLQRMLLNPNLSLGLSYHLTNFVDIRLEAAIYSLYSKTNEGFWYDEGFKSTNIEVYGNIVHHLFPKTYFDDLHQLVDPYIFGGIGITTYSPQPITPNPERDEVPLSGTATIFPVGVGANYYFKGNFSLGLEVGYRFTNTDLLDHASVAEDPNPKNDGYFMYRLKINLQFRKKYNYQKYLKRTR